MTAPTVQEAFDRALRQDAAAAPPQVPAPPRRVSEDRDAPFGRDDKGAPLIPHGVNKKTGRPNLKAPVAGAGRPSKDDKARVTEDSGGTGGKSAGKDYSADLAGLATGLWLTGSGLKSTAPYAAVLHENTPGLVSAWNKAAQQNAAVRAQVEKLAGEGSWAWVIQVVVATAPVVAACWDLAKPVKDEEKRKERAAFKAQLAEQTRAEAQAYVQAQFAELMAEQEEPAGQAAGLAA